MEKKWGSNLYVYLWRLRLRLMRMQTPKDAKTAEEMLREIKDEWKCRAKADSSGYCDILDKK